MAKHLISGKCPKCQEMMYLTLVDPVLREWFTDLQVRQPEVHLAYTYRGKAEQNKFEREGKSKAKFGKSPHNYIPVLAFDIFFLVNGKYYVDMNWLKQIANNMPDTMEWGGNFKGLVDGVHFERKNWKILAKNYPNGNKDEKP